MFHAFLHLLSYSWANLVSALGTTTLSIFLFSLLVPISIFIVTLIYQLRYRKPGVTVALIIKESLLSWQTLIPSMIYLLTWAGLLTWAISTTAYKDHSTLLARIRQLKALNASEREKYEATIAELKKGSAKAGRKSSSPCVRPVPGVKVEEIPAGGVGYAVRITIPNPNGLEIGSGFQFFFSQNFIQLGRITDQDGNPISWGTSAYGGDVFSMTSAQKIQKGKSLIVTAGSTLRPIHLVCVDRLLANPAK